jgi:predicted transcriptional regulator
MSIDRETFERSTEDELRDVSVPDQVLAFLTAHRDRAFKATEIARQLDLEPDTVSTALTRLKSRDFVEHKSTYWALTSDSNRLQHSADYERATQLFNKQLGVEEKADWEAHAPTEPHPSVESDDDTGTNAS